METTKEYFINMIAQTKNLYLTDFEPAPENPENKKVMLEMKLKN